MNTNKISSTRPTAPAWQYVALVVAFVVAAVTMAAIGVAGYRVGQALQERLAQAAVASQANTQADRALTQALALPSSSDQQANLTTESGQPVGFVTVHVVDANAGTVKVNIHLDNGLPNTTYRFVVWTAQWDTQANLGSITTDKNGQINDVVKDVYLARGVQPSFVRAWSGADEAGRMLNVIDSEVISIG